jgi:hypothetical protein
MAVEPRSLSERKCAVVVERLQPDAQVSIMVGQRLL